MAISSRTMANRSTTTSLLVELARPVSLLNHSLYPGRPGHDRRFELDRRTPAERRNHVHNLLRAPEAILRS